MCMTNIIVLPPMNSIAMCPSNNTETSPVLLTPFCAVAPHCLVLVSKIRIQITLETIYEEEEEEEGLEDGDDEKIMETPASSSSTVPVLVPRQAATCSSFGITGHVANSFGHNNYQCA